jgi:multidrug efflux pump
VKKFNLSEWALEHRSLVVYFMILFGIFGLFSYLKLGREEDPNFTIKTMVVSAQWPGASSEEMMNQVTERLERKLEEIDTLDYTKSVTSPGTTTIFVNLKDTVRGQEVARSWLRVRNILHDIEGTLPRGTIGPFFNDDFGDVFGNVYAFTADGLTQRQLRDYVEEVRRGVLTIPNAGKVELIGAQDEVIYLELSPSKLAAFGLDQQAVIGALQQQNAIAPSGVIDVGTERVRLTVSGKFDSEASLGAVNLRANDRFFRLSDVATIRRGYADPPQAMFRFNGAPAIGLAVGMRQSANLLVFGEALKAHMKRATADLPIGVDVHLVSDQPELVDHAVSGFLEALFEAIAIVLVVSFLSLGARAGLVVALAIPLVLAITFVVMEIMGISLQRISLGALIIALGLLVDDAMIAVEMMVARLEAGDPIGKAATAVYTSTAFPMLTGTLVTVASFIPVGLNASAAGEFTYTLFVVIVVSLVVSWIVAVLFTPLLGVALLPKTMQRHAEKTTRTGRMLNALLLGAMRHRWLTIGATTLAFLASVAGTGLVEQQFFPSSDRNELIIDWNLPQSASIGETRAQIEKLEQAQLVGNPAIEHFSSYIGQGAVRFVLSYDVQPPNPFFGQTVIVTKGPKERDELRKKLDTWLTHELPGTDALVHLLDIGPPVGRPVQYRVSGPDTQKVRALAYQVADVVSTSGSVGAIVYDWSEPARVVRVDVNQDKARQLGVSSAAISSTLGGIVSGVGFTQVLDHIYSINVVTRATDADRGSIERMRSLILPSTSGAPVPLEAIATFRYEVEQPLVWRRGRQPTLTVKTAVVGAVQPATVVAELGRKMDALRRTLPAGYAITTGGAVEESAKGQGAINAVVPLMLVAMATILMIQLQSFSRLFLVFAVAPLALIGVVIALVASHSPMGFVAMLGVLALIGILIRNSVILVVQIEDQRRDGMGAWEAVLDATQHRTRPILLTAAAASLALIPIAREVFWGPMAYAMMGGIIVGTVLTLLFLPALYLAWFKIKEPKSGGGGGGGGEGASESQGAAA